jgi:hypothetical protein
MLDEIRTHQNTSLLRFASVAPNVVIFSNISTFDMKVKYKGITRHTCAKRATMAIHEPKFPL